MRRTSGLLRLYRDLWLYAGSGRRLIAAAFALLLTSQLFKLAVPYLSGRAINVLQQHGLDGLRSAGLLLLLVLGATIASWLLHGPGRVLERNVALRVRQRLSAELIERTLSLPLAWHARNHTGETAHRVRQSSGALYDFAQSQFIYLQNAVRLIGPVIALWLISPLIGVAAVAGYAIIAFIIMRFDRVMVQFAHRENETERRYAAAVLDGLANVMSVFALRMKKGIMALIEQRLLAIYEPLRKSIVINEWKWCTVDILSIALSCALIALYVFLIVHGVQTIPDNKPALPLGNLFMVYEYSSQAGGVITAIAAHFQSFARQQADYTSGDAIREAEPSHLAADAAPARTWNTLQISDLSFRHAHDPASRPTLAALNFSLQRGKRYALIGGSGSGKSTLLRILSGLYIADSIRLCADAQAVETPLACALLLRDSSALIPQESELFEGSLAENLQLPERVDGPASAQDIARALHLARADTFVDKNQAGLNTHVAERGANWSGGQRQRIALARGVIAAHQRGLILLDEPTASLDPETERAVYGNLFEAFRECCVISSIHRLNLLDGFDEVLLMEQGELVAQGSVATLLEESAEFRALMAPHRRATDQAG